MKQGPASKEWVTTPSVYKIKPFKKVSVNKYFMEIKPILILLRVFGRLPYSFNEQGLAPFKLISFPVLYSLVAYIVQFVWTFNSISVIVHKKIYKAPSFDVTLFWASIGLVLILNFITPVTKLMDVHKIVKFISSWQDFEDSHKDIEIEMSMSLAIKIYAIVAIPISLVLISFESYLLSDLPVIILVPFVIALCTASISLVYTCATFYELRAISRKLLNKITTNGCRQMSTYRRSWLELSKLVSGFGEAEGVTGLAMTIIFFTSFVLTTYALLSSMFQSNFFCNHFWGLLMNCIMGITGHFILCDAAHRTTQEVGQDFSSRILALDLTHLNPADINEISLLLQTMSAHPPVVEYVGFVTINRSLFVSFVSNAVTYLVVLIQFKVSAPVEEAFSREVTE